MFLEIFFKVFFEIDNFIPSNSKLLYFKSIKEKKFICFLKITIKINNKENIIFLSSALSRACLMFSHKENIQGEAPGLVVNAEDSRSEPPWT